MSDGNENPMPGNIRFIDLFSGLGGTRLGVEMACAELGIGHECVLSCDKKASARKVYSANFGEEPEKDVVKLDTDEMGDFDMLLGGFPCFPSKVRVLTRRGEIPISEVVVGDEVWTHLGRWRKVLSTGKTAHARTVVLRGQGCPSLECTPNHPILSATDVPGEPFGALAEPEWTPAEEMPGRYWKNADAVRPNPDGPALSDEVGWWGTVYEIFPGRYDVDVFNLEIEEDNSYTAEGIFVHNCQPFSRAGMKRGFSDTRGTMFFEIERILEARKPKYVLLENVAELGTHDGGRTLSVIVEHLEALGYGVSHAVLDGADFGLAQSRRRIFIAGILDGEPLDFDDVEKSDGQAVMGDVMEHGSPLLDDDFTRAVLSEFDAEDLCGWVLSDKRRGSKTFHSWDVGLYGEVSDEQKELLETILSQQRKRKWAAQLGVRWRDGIPMNPAQVAEASGKDESDVLPLLEDLADKGYLIRRRPYKDDSLEEREDLPMGYKLVTSRVSFPLNRFLGEQDVCVTLTATDASHIGVVDGDGLRKLTRRECLRLFGFPDSYDLSCATDPEAYDLVGNSICVPVVAAVAKAMIGRDYPEQGCPAVVPAGGGEG